MGLGYAGQHLSFWLFIVQHIYLIFKGHIRDRSCLIFGTNKGQVMSQLHGVPHKKLSDRSVPYRGEPDIEMDSERVAEM